jgi:sec-independent protein translocase protein TatA
MGTLLVIGGQEIFLVMIVALVLFGADKIPDLARGLGKGMREFKKASDDIMAEINNSTKDIRKDISDVTDSVRKDMDKVTGSIMNQMDEVKTSVQQNIDDVTSNVTDVKNSVQQSWNNDPPRHFNDSSEERLYGPDGDYEAPYDYRETTQNYPANEPAANTTDTDNQQNINTIPDPRVSDPESPYFDPSQG